MGFFTEAELTVKHKPTIPLCGQCGLYKNCKNPKMAPIGKGQRKILIVGDITTHREDAIGKPLSGSDYDILYKELDECGVDLVKDCWLTNMVICKEPMTGVEPKHIKSCLPNINRLTQNLDPIAIILLGDLTIQHIMPMFWNSDKADSPERWYDWITPSTDPNAWVLPTYHPRDFEDKRLGDVKRMFFQEQLSNITMKTSKPWKSVRDYSKEVEIIYDSDQVVDILLDFCESGKDIAFDYETNCLKPEYPEAELVSCSVCLNGERTIAFLINEKTKKPLRTLLKSSCGKIAANLKFEDRWTRHQLGIEVNNWKFDTMLGAHWLDCRTGITGLKFQAFAQMGIPLYNKAVEEYLKSDEGHYNRIHHIDKHDLLLYNGMDSLLEWDLYKIMEKAL